jgi:phage gpG-like protein
VPDSEVKILGLARLRSTLRKAGVDMADMKEANVKASRTVSGRAEAIGPRRSGQLMGSLTNPRIVARAVVRSNLRYAPVIHYGWPAHHIRPQPFLSHAAADTQEQWLTAYEQDLQRIANNVEGV